VYDLADFGRLGLGVGGTVLEQDASIETSDVISTEVKTSFI